MAYSRRSRAPARRGSYRRSGSSYRSAPRRRSSSARGRSRSSRGQTVKLVIETQAASPVARPSYLAAMNPAFTSAGIPTVGKAKL